MHSQQSAGKLWSVLSTKVFTKLPSARHAPSRAVEAGVPWLMASYPYPALIRCGVYAILLGGIYWSAYAWLIQKDWSRPDYSASWIIPLVVLFLLREKRSDLERLPSSPTWAGLAALLPGIGLFWLGELSGEFFALYLSSWLVVVGLCWLHLGGQKLRVIAFPLGFCLAMFPLPHFLYNKISFNLKLLSSWLGVGLLQLSGLSVHREGNVIDLAFTRLQVVDACNGLRYLIPLIMLGILLAHFHSGRLWQKVLVVLSAIPLAIFSNSLRIASVGWLYPLWGARVAEGFFHDFSGWFIFMLTLALLLAEMRLLKKLFPLRPETAGPGGLPAASSGSPAGGTCRKSGIHPAPTVLAVVLLGATLAVSQWIDFGQKTPLKQPFERFPRAVGEWAGTPHSLETAILAELDLSAYLLMDYRNPRGEVVNFYTAFYESQRKGESIHSPETCLPGGGWVFRESGAVSFPVPDGSTLRVSRAVMEKSGLRQIAYYWFPQRGRVLTSLYQLKLFTFWDALTRQRTDGALVRLVTPLRQDESIAQADARLQRFAGTLVPLLEDFLPGREG